MGTSAQEILREPQAPARAGSGPSITNVRTRTSARQGTPSPSAQAHATRPVDGSAAQEAKVFPRSYLAKVDCRDSVQRSNGWACCSPQFNVRPGRACGLVPAALPPFRNPKILLRQSAKGGTIPVDEHCREDGRFDASAPPVGKSTRWTPRGSPKRPAHGFSRWTWSRS